ncbi:potassium voltage-gated channel subfamily H member 7-like isoform X2 [Limulus polyphemus]|uniref:Potassium voltage-gated channel subfamily H member 7-like isoform X2 n=1 Tax=Limulus polyphemus TaxID=6850 RepID=A0ABM1SD59_LIMPO|nr:potassium voltage-gated channel subfamily H member 7-like isoform X2 [Limulus polyphemus]
MPVRRGHVAPQNTFIDSIIRKFDNLNRRFIVANAQVENKPIIYCNDGFTELLGYSRGEIVQQSCMCEFLHGPQTSPHAVAKIAECLEESEERQVEIVYYKKDGSKFLCSQLMAPIRNEEGVISIFIINFEDLTDAPYRDEQIDVASPVFEPGKLVRCFPVFRQFLEDRPSSRTRSTVFQHCCSESAAALGKSLRLRLPGVRRGEEYGQEVDMTLTPDKDATMKTAVTSDQSSFFSHHAVERTRSLEIGDRSRTYPMSRDMDDVSRQVLGPVTPVKSLDVAYQVHETLKTFPFAAVCQLCSTVPTTESQRRRSLTIVIGQANNLSKPLPNASSDSDLSRFRSHQQRSRSPSLSNAIVENNTKPRENNHSSTRSKLFREMQVHNKHNVGEKVAQVLSLGTDVLPEYKIQKPHVHKWTILHYSPFKAFWDWIILILVIYTAIFTPYVAAFLLNESKPKRNKKYGDDPIVIIDLIVDVMFIIDILINFRTTYVNSNEEVVSHPSRIAVHYLRGWFIIDLVAAIPFDLLLFGSETDETTTLIGLLKTARLLRLVRVARKIDRYSEYGAAVLLLLVATFSLIAHWLACIWYAIGNAERNIMENKIGWLDHLANDTNEFYNNSHGGPSIKAKYVTALYFTISSLTSVGFGNVAPNTNMEKIFSILVMLIGCKSV